MQFDIITIFPNIFDSYFSESLIERAVKKKLIKIKAHDLRKYTKDKHKKATPAFATRKRCGRVDDKAFGGGLGMVMQVQPIYDAVKKIKGKKKSKVVLFTPRGKKFNQKMAHDFSKLNQVIFICGRYEAVDERVAKKIADVELSIGDYVLMGGEIPAMAVIESVTRLIPGAIGKEELLGQRITKSKGFIEYAQYTRPEAFNPGKYSGGWKACPPKFRKGSWRVPKVLMSGDHKKIEEWKKKHSKVIEK